MVFVVSRQSNPAVEYTLAFLFTIALGIVYEGVRSLRVKMEIRLQSQLRKTTCLINQGKCDNCEKEFPQFVDIFCSQIMLSVEQNILNQFSDF
jgi:hypothetical protein